MMTYEQLLQEAIQHGKSLGRPFTEQEIFQFAWEQGYELTPGCSPCFKEVGMRKDGTMLYLVDDRPVVYLRGFLVAVTGHAMTCKNRAHAQAGEQQRQAHKTWQKLNKTYEQLVRESLVAQGWTNV